MITLEEDLPREITRENAVDFVGESVFWYCHQCKEWHTTEIAPGGVITCPHCGLNPEWKKGTVFVSITDRLKRVRELCADGSPLHRKVVDVEGRYAAFIDKTWRGMPKREKDSGWRSFQREWRTLDELTDYLIAAKDIPADDIPHAFSNEGLKRLDFNPARENKDANGDSCGETSKKKSYKCVSYLSDMRLRRPDYDKDITDFEILESSAIKNGYMQPSPSAEDEFFRQDMFRAIADPVERNIALDFANGLIWKKRDAERKYGLTEAKLRTKINHIGKVLVGAGLIPRGE